MDRQSTKQAMGVNFTVKNLEALKADAERQERPVSFIINKIVEGYYAEQRARDARVPA